MIQSSANASAVSVIIAICVTAAFVLQAQQAHDLTLRPHNVHWGYYDPSREAGAAHRAPATRVRVETMIARGLQRLRAAGVEDDEIPESLKVVERAVTERGPGRASDDRADLCRRRRAGRFARDARSSASSSCIRTASAASSPAAARCPTSFPTSASTWFASIPRAGTATLRAGHHAPLAPFFGSIGVAPNPLVGRISSGPPGPHVGNLDNKDWSPARRSTCRCTSPARCCRSATATRCRATAK